MVMVMATQQTMSSNDQHNSDNGQNGHLQNNGNDNTNSTNDAQNSVIANGANGANGGAKAQRSAKKRPINAKPLRSLTKRGPPGGYDDTPLPDAPQGYTVKFTFHGAVNLPPSDWDLESDPFLVATLKAGNPKRHKEDPDLVHRTPTHRSTTNPEWNDEWIVANVPPTGFSLKCRMYDEDYPDRNDRLGNVTIKVPSIDDSWQGIPIPGREYNAKKRMISKRAFFLKGLSGVMNHNFHMTPRLRISIEVLRKSDPPYAQMCTIGPSSYFQHFSPMLGRLTGTKLSPQQDEEDRDGHGNSEERPPSSRKEKKSQKYDFQAVEMQLKGPVPSQLYHRFVEFRPMIGYMFTSKGLRGRILHAALHKQHSRVYNFDKSTKYGLFQPCSQEAALQFLKLAHFDEGGRIFTYVLTLDGLFRFTETGKEFGIDMLSKHTMHSDVARYIACSGEFFIRRLEHSDGSDEAVPAERTHPGHHLADGPPKKSPPMNPSYYQLIIDNDSGTYRPDKRILPLLKAFLQEQFPGMGIVTLDCADETLIAMKKAQLSAKKKEGRMVNMVMNMSQSSLSSAESDLAGRDDKWEAGHQSKREKAYGFVEDPSLLKGAVKKMMPGQQQQQQQHEVTGEGSRQATERGAA